MKKKLAIITAVYNRGQTIQDALESLAAQSVNDIVHIIIDGASTDSTIEVIEKFRKESTHFISEEDSGIYNALNKGLKLANAEVFGFLHSDDVYASEDVLVDVVEAFEDESIDGVYGDLEYTNFEMTRVIRHWKAGHYEQGSLKLGWMPPHPTLFLRKRVVNEYGGFDESFQISADYDAILRYLKIGKIRLQYIPKVLVRMRVGGASNRSVRQIIRKLREDAWALKNNNLPVISTLIFKNLRKLPQFFGISKRSV